MSNRLSKLALNLEDVGSKEFDAKIELIEDFSFDEPIKSFTSGNYNISDFGSNPSFLGGIAQTSFQNAGSSFDIGSLNLDLGGLNLGSFGSISTMGAGQKQTIGFKDPKDVWPTKDREEESDWHRFTGRPPEKLKKDSHRKVRAIPPKPQDEYKETHSETRKENRVGKINKVRTANAPEWEEPESEKKSIYGQNWVVATPGGVTTEIDSTEGSQAWRVTHPSNSFMEITPKGDFVQKTFASRIDIIAKDHNSYINDNRSIDVHGNDDLRVQGTYSIVVDKDKTEIDRGDSSLTVFKSYSRNVCKDDALIVGQNQSIYVMMKQNNRIGVKQDNFVGMMRNDTIGAKYDLKCLGQIAITAGALLDVKAAMVKIKAGMIMLN